MTRAEEPTVITFHRSDASIVAVQDEIAALWRAHPWIDVVDRMALETALVELVTNVIKYALRDGAETAELQLIVRDTELTASVTDHGTAFRGNLSRVTMPGPEAESGRGLAAISSLTDIFEYRRRAAQNQWTIVRRLTVADAGAP